MSHKQVHLAVLNKEERLISHYLQISPTCFLEPLGPDKNCLFSLPALHLFTDLNFIKNHFSTTLAVLNYTFSKIPEKEKQHLLLSILETVNKYSASPHYEKHSQAIKVFVIEHLNFEYYGHELEKKENLNTLPLQRKILELIESVILQPIEENKLKLPSLSTQKLFQEYLKLNYDKLKSVPTLFEQYIYEARITSNFYYLKKALFTLNKCLDKPYNPEELFSLVMERITFHDTNSLDTQNIISKQNYIEIFNYFDNPYEDLFKNKNYYMEKDVFFSSFEHSRFNNAGKDILFLTPPHKIDKLALEQTSWSVEQQMKELEFLKKNLNYKLQYNSFHIFNQEYLFSSYEKPLYPPPGSPENQTDNLVEYMRLSKLKLDAIKTDSCLSYLYTIADFSRGLKELLFDQYGRAQKVEDFNFVADFFKEEFEFISTQYDSSCFFAHNTHEQFFEVIVEYALKHKFLNIFNIRSLSLAMLEDTPGMQDILQKHFIEYASTLDKELISEKIKSVPSKTKLINHKI